MTRSKGKLAINQHIRVEGKSNFPALLLPSMTAENFLVNNRSDGQAVEAICKCFPQFDIVSTFTLIIKSYKEQSREEGNYFRVKEDEKLDFPIFMSEVREN